MDTMARAVAQQMQTRLGQPVVVENRPGAGTTIGAKAVVNAEPDGLHPDVGHAVDGRDRAGALQGPRLRSEGARAGRAGRGIPERAGDPAEPAGQHDGGVHRLRQSPSRQAELRRLARHAAAADGRDVQQGRRPRHDLRALQGRRAVDARPDRRPPAHAVRRADAAACRWSRRASCARLRFRRRSAGPTCPTCRPCAKLGFADFPGNAWAGHHGAARARRSRSSTSSTPPSTTSCARPKPRQSLAKLNVLLRPGSPQEFAAFIAKETPAWTQMVRESGATAQ